MSPNRQDPNQGEMLDYEIYRPSGGYSKKTIGRAVVNEHFPVEQLEKEAAVTEEEITPKGMLVSIFDVISNLNSNKGELEVYENRSTQTFNFERVRRTAYDRFQEKHGHRPNTLSEKQTAENERQAELANMVKNREDEIISSLEILKTKVGAQMVGKLLSQAGVKIEEDQIINVKFLSGVPKKVREKASKALSASLK